MLMTDVLFDRHLGNNGRFGFFFVLFHAQLNAASRLAAAGAFQSFAQDLGHRCVAAELGLDRGQLGLQVFNLAAEFGEQAVHGRGFDRRGV